MEKNIAETIGCEYEMVVIDNSKNSHSIFSAYNEGVRRAKGDILCFMHEDILYKTKNWGEQVKKLFENEDIGVVGLMGAYIMTKDYGYWTMMNPYVTGFVPLLAKNGEMDYANCDFYYGKDCSNEVVTID